MKKVYHFVYTGNYSGAENVVLNISDLLTNYNHTYVSPSGKIDNVLLSYPIKHLVIDKLNYHNFKTIIKRDKPDIVHCHDIRASLYGALLSGYIHSYGGKVVSHLHSNDPRMKTVTVRSLIYKIFLSKFDEIVVVSDSIINEYKFKNSLPATTKVIPNIINTERIYKSIDHTRNIKYDLCFVGRLVEEKNPILFLEIIAKLKQSKSEIRCVMVGTGELLDSVKSFILENNLANNIDIIGFSKNPYKYMNQSRLQIITSQFEGFGLVALEAMSLGLPVIASDVGGLPDLIGNTGGQIVTNKEDFVKSTEFYLDNTSEYNKFSKMAYKRAEQVNDVEMFIRSVNSLYIGSKK